jgi:hypothetical protein
MVAISTGIYLRVVHPSLFDSSANHFLFLLAISSQKQTLSYTWLFPTYYFPQAFHSPRSTNTPKMHPTPSPPLLLPLLAPHPSSRGLLRRCDRRYRSRRGRRHDNNRRQRGGSRRSRSSSLRDMATRTSAHLPARQSFVRDRSAGLLKHTCGGLHGPSGSGT